MEPQTHDTPYCPADRGIYFNPPPGKTESGSGKIHNIPGTLKHQQDTQLEATGEKVNNNPHNKHELPPTLVDLAETHHSEDHHLHSRPK